MNEPEEYMMRSMGGLTTMEHEGIVYWPYDQVKRYSSLMVKFFLKMLVTYTVMGILLGWLVCHAT